jgi:hypothetical protein
MCGMLLRQFSMRLRCSSGSEQITSMNFIGSLSRAARFTHCSRAGSTALTASIMTPVPATRIRSASVSATR